MKKTLLLLVVLITATIAFAYDVQIDDIYYNLNNETKTAEITNLTGRADTSTISYFQSNITIPEKITYHASEYSVISIGNNAFCNCPSLTSIIIPNSITSIGDWAFSYCTSLTSITIPNDVTSIGNYAFYYCSSLTSITIPNSVTSIGSGAFQSCSSLKSITIPNSVTSIGNSAFSGCRSLTSITIPNSVTSIGNSAFSSCSSLTSISIPNSVTSIGKWTFYYCKSLTSISIPNSVTSIGNDAFSSCSSLTSISIPNSVTSIGNDAFRDCSNIKTINIHADNLENYCKSNLNQTISNKISNNSSTVRHLFIDGVEITELNIPENVTSISSYAFYNCDAITSISIPNSVTSIGYEAFSDCDALTTIQWNAKKCNNFSSNNYAPFYSTQKQITSFTFGDSVEHIPAYLCYGMIKLTSITIPNSVTSIGDAAFRYCSSLTSITIPNSVTSIGGWAFYNCSSLDTLICNYNDSLIFDTHIDYNPFKIPTLRYLTAPAVVFNTFREGNQTSFSNRLTEVHISDGDLDENGFNFINRSYKSLHTIDLAGATNTTINDLAFYDCYKLENLTLPKNIETIGYKAFAECVHIKQLEIPATVTNIEERAFENCRSINTLTFEESSALESIGSWAFYNNHALESVELPEGVKEIGDAAFYGCTYVEEIVIPASVQRIGDNGFALCNQVKRMEVRATTPPAIEAKTFHQVSRSIEFIVPTEARNAYAQDEYWREFIQEAPTNVENTIEGIEIYTQNGTLHFEGLTADYQIYNMSGQMVYSGNSSTLDLAKGIYIIRINDKSQKIVL